MVVHKGAGIADDADAYAELEPRSVGKARPGIADDAELFDGLVEDTGESRRTLESDWLYQRGGQVFGPVKPKELLEMLYRGDIGPDALVACGDDDYRAVRHYGAFQPHLPKIEAHLAEVAATNARGRAETQRRWLKRSGLAIVSVGLVAAAGLLVVPYVRESRQRAAEAEKVEMEEALKRELESLLASVTIEPPLLPLVADPVESKEPTKRRKKRRGAAGGIDEPVGQGATGELTKTEIMQGVMKVFGGFKRCIVAQIQRDPESVPKQLVLTFSVGNDGRARDVSMADRHLRRAPITPCLASQLSQVRWRSYVGEVQSVEYPISVGR